MEVVLLCIIASLFFVLGRTIDKWVLTHKIKNSYTFFYIFSISLTIVSIVAIFFIDFKIPGLDILFVIAASAFLHAAGYFAFYKALLSADISTIAPLSALKFVFIIPLTYLFAGEFYGIWSIFFILLTFVGTILTTWDEKTQITKIFKFKNLAFPLMMAATTIWIVSDLFAKNALQHMDSFSFNIWRYILALIILVIVSPIFLKGDAMTEFKKKFKETFGIITVSVVFFGVAIVLFFIAVTTSLQISTVVTSASYSVFGLIIGALVSKFAPNLLKEKHSRKIYLIRGLGVLIIIVGIFSMINIL